MIISLSVVLHYVHYCHPNLKRCHQDTRSCVFMNVAYLPKVCIHHYYHGVIVIFKSSSISAKILKTEGLGENKIHIYETYWNAVMLHVRHIYATAYDLEKAIMCEYSQSNHALPHLKYVLRCWAKCPSITLPDQETDDNHPNPSSSIRFNIYHLIACCTKHGRLLLTDKKSCRKCQQDTASGQPTKIYTRKELVTMETTISNFHASFYSSNPEVGVSNSTRTNTGYE